MITSLFLYAVIGDMSFKNSEYRANIERHLLGHQECALQASIFKIQNFLVDPEVNFNFNIDQSQQIRFRVGSWIVKYARYPLLKRTFRVDKLVVMKVIIPYCLGIRMIERDSLINTEEPVYIIYVGTTRGQTAVFDMVNVPGLKSESVFLTINFGKKVEIRLFDVSGRSEKPASSHVLNIGTSLQFDPDTRVFLDKKKVKETSLFRFSRNQVRYFFVAMKGKAISLKKIEE